MSVRVRVMVGRTLHSAKAGKNVPSLSPYDVGEGEDEVEGEVEAEVELMLGRS